MATAALVTVNVLCQFWCDSFIAYTIRIIILFGVIFIRSLLLLVQEFTVVICEYKWGDAYCRQILFAIHKTRCKCYISYAASAINVLYANNEKLAPLMAEQ